MRPTRGLVYFCDSHEGMRMNKACYRDSAPVVQKRGKHYSRINLWLVSTVLSYPLDRDLSGGLRAIQRLKTGGRSSRHYKQAWVKEKKTAGRLRRERKIPSLLHIRSQAFIWGRAYCINGITGEDSVATPLLLTPRIYNLINEKKSRVFSASLATLRIFAFAHTWMLQVKFNSPLALTT